MVPVEDCPGLLLVGAVEDVEGDGLHSKDKGGDVLVTQPFLGRYAARPLLVVTLHVHPTRGKYTQIITTLIKRKLLGEFPYFNKTPSTTDNPIHGEVFLH
jgi:hypothetical protein